MKTIVKRLSRDEKGQALVIALILLALGGLIAAPLLAYMNTGLTTGGIYERRTDELYAADAGVEDAVWKIQKQVDKVKGLTQCHQSWSYDISDVNGKSVDVTVTLTNNVTGALTYKITSIAVSDDGGNTAGLGSSTQIEAYVTATVTYLSIMDNLVTVQQDLDDNEVAALENDLSKLDISCPEGCTECEKCGHAYDYNSDAYRDIPQKCKGCIAVYNFPGADWPTVSDLSARYGDDVKDETSDPRNTIDLDGVDREEGPLYRNGILKILNNNNEEAATLTLDGTLYITGDTEIGMNGGGSNKPNLTIELNGQTIFVASSSTGSGHEALKIGPWCTINGPGCIIAVGDIYFRPNGQAGANEEPAFVLSVSGTTRIQPNIDFLGAVAGKVDVDVQSGNPAVSYPTGGFGEVNFPSLFEAYRTYRIASWEVVGRQ